MNKIIRKFSLAGIIFAISIIVILVFMKVNIGVLMDQRDVLVRDLSENVGRYDEQSIVLRGIERSDAEEMAQKLGASLRITKDGSYARLTLPEGLTISDVLNDNSNLKYIAAISVDYKATTAELDDILEENYAARPQFDITDDGYSAQTYLNYLGLDNVWELYNGTGVSIAVIDSGIDTDHPEFEGRISEYSYNATEDKIVKDFIDEDGNYDWSLIEDEQGHGTAVAGVISSAMDGAGIVGIAPNAEIIVIKAECDMNGEFLRTSDLVFGLYYAIERDVDVVNMSFGTDVDNPFSSATQLAYDSDIICVAAAGNKSTAKLHYPAADPYVIGVGSIDENWMLTNYSNYGDNSDIVAPGSTYTTVIGGGYEIEHGTSMSSPIVAAIMGLYKQKSKYETNDDIVEVLYASSVDLGDLGEDWDYGYGAIDAKAFIMESRGVVTFEMLTDEVADIERIFIKGHALQSIPEPERLYAVFDGWYYDDTFTEEYRYYEDEFMDDITLYAKWVNEDDGIPFTYVILDDGTVEIRSYTGNRRYVSVPYMIDGRVVSSIGDFAFSGQQRIREITLPSGITYIGCYAFELCDELRTITIPAGVQTIDDYAFTKAVRLRNVIFESGSMLHSLGDGVFSFCINLDEIILPKSLERVNGSAFFGTSSLKNIYVNAGNPYITSIEGVLYSADKNTLIAYPTTHGAFYTVDENTTVIDTCAFAYSNIHTIQLPEIIYIKESAFAYSSIAEIDIPDSVIEIAKEAFSSCRLLQNVKLSKSINKIDEGIFENCESLKTIYIPYNIRTIENNAFASSGLRSIQFADESKLEQIGKNAFKSTRVEELYFPRSLEMIGDSAFSYCRNLNYISFEDGSSIVSIGNWAFENSGLTSINMPEGLMSIGEQAFYATSVSEVTIPASVKILGGGAFAACDSLITARVSEGNEYFHDIDGVVYSVDNTTIFVYPAGRTQTTYALIDTTRKIEKYTFARAKSLYTVVLPEGMEVLGQYSFADSEIAYIELPQSLKEIGTNAFEYCTNLSQIFIPDNVIMIGRLAFSGCSALKNIYFNSTSKMSRLGNQAFAYSGIESFTIPANVSTMGQKVFIGCDSLYTVTFAPNSKLESISAYMFDGCTNLQQIHFGEGSSLKSIQAHGLEGLQCLRDIDFQNTKLENVDNFAFRFCGSLESIVLPDTVTNIGRYAFYGCKNLEELSIPDNVEHIGSYAFSRTKDINLYFSLDKLPEYLDENWDNGIVGYYVGVISINDYDGYKYAIMSNGNISIIKYNGSATVVNLDSLDLGGEIVSIGGGAFKDSNVVNVLLPRTLVEIHAEAFMGSGITDIEIPATVKFIGREAFASTPLATVTFAGNSVLKSIESYAFNKTYQLKAVVIPASVNTLGTGVFMESGLERLLFEDNSQLSTIPKKAFAKTKLVDITLPDSVTLLDDNAFYGVETLRNVEFGRNDGIRIMSNVFYGTGLTNVYIPENVTYIGEYSFVGLTLLNEFEVASNNSNYKSVDGLLLTKSGRKLIAAPAGMTGSITVPVEVEEIGFGAFENTKLSSINFYPYANILSFGYRAFFGAQNITEITIPASVVSIDYYAFAYCESLERVVFVDGCQLKGIYEGAFCGDISLADINIPSSIVEISEFAFYGCSNITELKGDNIEGIYDYAYAYTGLAGDLVIPDSITDIGDYAFLGTNITSVVIPDTNKYDLVIGIGAFEDCNKMHEITLPFIGRSFEDSEIAWFGYIFGAGNFEANEAYVPESLEVVTITEGLTEIGTGGFAYCSGLKEINIPHSVTDLHNYAFFGTTASYQITNEITAYEYDYWEEKYTPVLNAGHLGAGIYGKLVLSDTITEVGDQTFRNCKDIEEIVFGDGITELNGIGLYGHDKLESIVLGDNIRIIGDSTFENCSSLSTITLPASLEKIGDRAFYGNTSLYKIINNSDLDIIFDYRTHGAIGNYAVIIIDKYNNISYNFGDSQLIVGDFVFEVNPSGYILRAYLGDEDVIYLPENVNGEQYTLNFSYGGKKIIIPETFSSINDNAFYNNKSIEEIIIPDSITSIGASAFAACSNLKKIVIPDSVTDIEWMTFSWCSKLEDVTISNNLETIPYGMFRYCSSLQNIAIPDSVTLIEGYAFEHCENLNSVKLSQNLYETHEGVFYECYNLKYIEYPASYTKISMSSFPPNAVVEFAEGSDYFAGEDGIIYNRDVTSIIYVPSNIEIATIPGSVTYIPDFAFENKVSLAKVVLEDGVERIGENAFRNCSNLREVVIPNSVTYIDSYAFAYCSSLKQIKIPQNVTYIEHSMFYMCSSLETVVWSDNITGIDNYAFSGCTELNNIKLPKSLNSIGWSAFASCSSIEDITIPEGVAVIQNGAFSGCSSLKSIYFPDGVTTIESGAIGYCENLEYIRLGANVTQVDWMNTFQFSTNLNTIEVSAQNEYYKVVDGMLIDIAGSKIIVAEKDLTGDVIIPEDIKEIGNYAFANCVRIENVIVPDSLNAIGGSAFENCGSLTNVDFIKNISVIKPYTFSGCTSLYEIVIPESITQIEDSAFRNTNIQIVHNYSSLNIEFYNFEHGYVAYNAKMIVDKNGNISYANGYESFEIITTYDGFVFYKYNGKYELAQYIGDEEIITLPDSINGCQYTLYKFNGAKHVIIPDTFTTISREAFSCNYTLESVVIPDSVRTIEYAGFINCVSLRNINIPDSVTVIEDYAFSSCESLESIYIPNSVVSIGDSAFSGCCMIEEVNIPESVQKIGADAFEGTQFLNNPDNREHGMLILNGWLLAVDSDLEYMSNINRIKHVADGVYSDCDKLRLSVWTGGGTIPSNVETIVVNSLSNSSYMHANSLTIKNIVLSDSVSVADIANNPYVFANLSNVTIFVEGDEEDYHWDNNFVSWNNGNRVVYGDNWIWVNFYDQNGKIISSAPMLTSQVIRRPVLEFEEKDGIAYEFLGWDIDSDGIPDSIPATSITDIDIYPVVKITYEIVLNNITGNFTSCASMGDAVISLLKNGIEIYTLTYKETTESGLVTREYMFEDVEPGVYTMSVSMVNHVTREYEIIVEDSDVVQDVKIHPIGDLDGNGKVNSRDWNAVRDHINKSAVITDEYKFACADLDGNGKVNSRDWNRIRDHINKSNPLW